MRASRNCSAEFFSALFAIIITDLALAGDNAIWIACKLLKPTGGDSHDVKTAATFWGAMQTIVIADAAMGLDNVIAVAGAVHEAVRYAVYGVVGLVVLVAGLYYQRRRPQGATQAA